MALREVNYAAIVFRIISAFVLGGIIGLERGMKNRPAGLRTYMLVCVGSCLIMLTNQYIYQVFGAGDPVRMGAQVVSGIGFLGAGTIVVTKRNQIKGLTTAAGLWAAAAVGLALGIGFYEAAFLGGTLVFVIITVIHSWDNQIHRFSKTAEVYVELSRDISLAEFTRSIRDLDIEVDGIQMEHDNIHENGTRSFIVCLKTKIMRTHAELFSDIRSIPGVIYLEGL